MMLVKYRICPRALLAQNIKHGNNVNSFAKKKDRVTITRVFSYFVLISSNWTKYQGVKNFTLVALMHNESSNSY